MHPAVHRGVQLGRVVTERVWTADADMPWNQPGRHRRRAKKAPKDNNLPKPSTPLRERPVAPTAPVVPKARHSERWKTLEAAASEAFGRDFRYAEGMAVAWTKIEARRAERQNPM